MQEKIVTDEGQQRVVDRLRYILFDMNKNETELSRECGISMGVISNAKRPGYDLSELQVRRIIDKYPFINPSWLLRGEGERYRDMGGTSAADAQGRPNTEALEAKIREQERVIRFLMDANTKLMEQVSSLVAQIDGLLNRQGPAAHSDIGQPLPPQKNNA